MMRQPRTGLLKVTMVMKRKGEQMFGSRPPIGSFRRRDYVFKSIWSCVRPHIAGRSCSAAQGRSVSEWKVKGRVHRHFSPSPQGSRPLPLKDCFALLMSVLSPNASTRPSPPSHTVSQTRSRRTKREAPCTAETSLSRYRLIASSASLTVL